MTRDADNRAADLLARMTIEEKAQQITGVAPWGLIRPGVPDRAQLDHAMGQGIGHVGMFAMFQHRRPHEHAASVNAIQRYLVENTRLGIPAIFHIEAISGLVAPHFTAFPTSIALAGTWNPAAVQEMAAIISRQARAIGYVQALSPVMDVARDARWGRVHETYGEDPYLVSEFSCAYTRGLQGEDLTRGVIATGKHFLGFAATEGGQHMAATVATNRELREVYARPFEAAIASADLRSVMNSYSTVDGVPVGADPRILNDLLRGELGFNGSVVADYGTLFNLVERQQTAATFEDAARQGLEAGLDVELPDAQAYGTVVATAVREGRIPESLLDQAVLRVLADKFRTGLFEHPYVDEDPAALAAIARDGADLASTLATQSVVLLDNNGTLPIAPEVRRIAVIGPHANNAGVGFAAYSYVGALGLIGAVDDGDAVRMAGLEDAASSLPLSARETLRSELEPPLAAGFDEYARNQYGSESLFEALLRRAGNADVVAAAGSGVLDGEPHDIQTAVDAARGADVVVLALGGRAGWFGDAQTEGEGSDQSDIDLPAIQVELARAVAATGVAVVAVVFTGRPFALTRLRQHVPTIVLAPYGGAHAAAAVAEVLLGTVNPSGRLPISIPRHSGQVPVHYAQHVGSGYRRTPADAHPGYNDMVARPQYAFGHGLSYTQFAYEQFEVGAQIETGGMIDVSVSVVNTGRLDGVEVVQFYAVHRVSGLTRPAQQLIAFARVELTAGSRVRVRARVSTAQLAYVGREGRLQFDASELAVQVGSSSEVIHFEAPVQVTGPTADWSGRRPLLPEVTVVDAESSRVE